MRMILVIAFFCACLGAARAQNNEPASVARTDMAMRNWKSVGPAFLRDPANADIRSGLRTKVFRSRDPRAVVLLLKIDDPEVVRLRITEFMTSRRDAGEDIARSGNANLIMKLAPAVFKDEDAQIQKTGDGNEVVRTTPLSVRAAFVVRHIVLNSSSFNAAVKNWANRLFALGSNSSEEDRQEIRTWITVNKRALEAGEYARIVPPR